MKLRDWFQYSDRNNQPYNPTVGTTITIEKLWQGEASESSSSDWRLEEWLIHSFLVPTSQLNDAATKITSPAYSTFEVGWDFEDRFSFGDSARHGEVELYPLTTFLKHPITQEYTVELSREFFNYHALVRRNQYQYFHPVDNLSVAETGLDSHKLYDPSPSVVIHRDYLRDFLAATGRGLLICITADRFANAPTEQELELEQIEDTQIDEYTWLSTSIHAPEHTRQSNFRGRSILRRNLIVMPYDRPKYERNPWPYYGDKPVEEGRLPLFIVNEEGEQRNLLRPDNLGKFGYLYFRPEVLQKFLRSPECRVFFHMRNWGGASLPGERGSIDVGINSQGLVNAFAPHIADLNPSEQSYWASFSSLPSGEVCEEMFQTRMQQNPPHSPGVVDLIRNTRSRLNGVFNSSFAVDLFKDIEPSAPERDRLSVGPLGNQFNEVLELAQILYGWLIETMEIDPLRTVLGVLGGTVDSKLRQIKLLERILMAKGEDQTQARSITAPLVGLNELRIGSAHIGSVALEANFQLMGASIIPQTPREGWNLCVDSAVACINLIIAALRI
jgi:hypothetical protein